MAPTTDVKLIPHHRLRIAPTAAAVGILLPGRTAWSLTNPNATPVDIACQADQIVHLVIGPLAEGVTVRVRVVKAVPASWSSGTITGICYNRNRREYGHAV
jgi:hypothetical protein